MPCIIEKPLGISFAEAEKLARVAQETATPHMVSVNRRFMPYLTQARQWISEIGPLRYVSATQVRHARDEPDFIWSTAIHVLDALRSLAGEIREFDTDVLGRPESTALWYVISLGFESGAHGLVEVLPTAGMVEESYELFGEGFRGRVTAGSGAQRSLECWRDGQKVVDEKTSDDVPEDLRNGAYQEVEEFVRALRTGTRPRPEVEDILPSARVCFAIAESVARQTVRAT
jgi:predicted dehydrogenase